MHQLAIFCSGNGTNAQAILDRFAAHQQVRVACVLANKPDAYALERGRAAGLPVLAFSKQEFLQGDAVHVFLQQNGVTCLVLAGFLWLMPVRLLRAYPDKVLNVHPALLPDFGGAGMYGRRVHEAVALAGRTETGITVHLADDAYDRGPILLQARAPLPQNASADDVERAARALELIWYGPAIEAYLTGRVR